MFEESADGFVNRWREYAATVRIFSRTEGLPLLEAEAGGAILQMLERTGPYLAPPGAARMIINPTAQSVELHYAGRKAIEVGGLGQAHICGEIVRRDDPFLVIDAGAPLIVGVMEPIPDEAVAGTSVAFQSLPPIHGFVLPEARPPTVRGGNGETL